MIDQTEVLLPLSSIVFATDADGDDVNPRGRVNDTTDLQDSMATVGQLEPITVYRHYLDEDCYVVLSGHRRVIAARIIKWETIRAVIVDMPESDGDLLDRMLAHNVRQDLSLLALARALRKRMAFGVTDVHVAMVCGLTASRVNLLVSLLDAPESVQKRVNSGDMSLSAWKVLRDKPQETQEKAAALEKPTVAAVRRTTKTHHPGGSQIDDMLASFEADHQIVVDLEAMPTRLAAEWDTFTPLEVQRVTAAVGRLLALTDDIAANEEVVNRVA